MSLGEGQMITSVLDSPSSASMKANKLKKYSS
jgi:hypothetical protein